MNFKQQQKNFDGVKWFDSIQMGSDRCGSYAFCSQCNKEEKNPCAKAQHRYHNGYIRIASIRKHSL